MGLSRTGLSRSQPTHRGVTNFGQAKLGQHHISVLMVGWGGGGSVGSGPGRGPGEGFRGEGPHRGREPRRGARPRNMSPRRVGPVRWGPKGGARRVGAQNFALSFFLSRHNFHSFFPLTVCLLVEFWWCFEAPCPQPMDISARRDLGTEGIIEHSHLSPRTPEPFERKHNCGASLRRNCRVRQAGRS